VLVSMGVTVTVVGIRAWQGTQNVLQDKI
jgi:hypothetical protein